MPASSFDLTKTLFWKALLKIIRFFMVACSVISTGCIIYSVVLRYVFELNFYGSDEVILLFAFWLYYMGAVYGSYEDSHIKADLLNVYVKNLRVKDGINLFAQLLTSAVNIILLVWAGEFFLWGLEKMPATTALKIPLVLPQSAIFFGLLLMAFYHIYYLQRNMRCYFKRGYFSVPQDGDYVSEKLKEKFPDSSAPLRAAVKKEALDAADVKGGNA